jgi:hypothetical protein
VTVEPGEAFSVEVKIPWQILEKEGLKKNGLHVSLAENEPLESASEFLRTGNKLYLSGLRPTPSPYTVRLHFAELEHDQEGQRVFDVKLSGKVVLKDFDIFAAAGGRGKAVIKEFKSIPAAQSLVVELVAKKSDPILSGMQVLAEKPGPLPPAVLAPLHKGDFTHGYDPDPRKARQEKK